MLLAASAYIASLSIQQCMCLLVHLGLVQLIRKPVGSYSSVMVSKFKTVAKKKKLTFSQHMIMLLVLKTSLVYVWITMRANALSKECLMYIIRKDE